MEVAKSPVPSPKLQRQTTADLLSSMEVAKSSSPLAISISAGVSHMPRTAVLQRQSTQDLLMGIDRAASQMVAPESKMSIPTQQFVLGPPMGNQLTTSPQNAAVPPPTASSANIAIAEAGSSSALNTAAPSLASANQQHQHVKVENPKPAVRKIEVPKVQVIPMPPMPAGYRVPTKEEMAYTTQLVGALINIYWDGEGIYYPAKVVSYIPATRQFKAVYVEEAEPRVQYDEDLSSILSKRADRTVWAIWDGAKAGYGPTSGSTRQSLSRHCKPAEGAHVYRDDGNFGLDMEGKQRHAPQLSAKGSYESMAVDSVAALNNKIGSSLQAIRNYISKNWNVSNMHAASYNKKTIDGLNLAVANQRLERVKIHTYKLTGQEINNRRALAQQKRRRAIAEVDGTLPRGAAGKSKNGWSISLFLENLVQCGVVR